MNPDQLALLALGESADHGDGPAVSGHLRQCVSCRDEIESLRLTVSLAREAVQDRDTPPPSEAVWSRIAAATGIGPTPADLPPVPRLAQPDPRLAQPDPRLAQPDPRLGPLDPRLGPLDPGPGRAGGRLGQHRAPEPPAGPLRFRRGRLHAAVALAAAAVIGVVGTLGTLHPWRSDPATVTASAATLTAVAGGPGEAHGRAVVERGPGGPLLRITATGLPLQQGYFEVWVYDGKRDMVAIGVLGADSTASLPLPPTLDLRTYHVVDISQEQYDGNQGHSQTSVLRGSLTE